MDYQSRHAIKMQFSAIEHTGTEEWIDLQESSKASVIGTIALIGAQDSKYVKSRAYQLEMLEESIKRNIIVAMDTGSGKTQVAVLRIKHELENATNSNQHGVLQSQISSVQIKSLSSNDNVDRWTDEAQWNAVLDGVRIIVSTYAVLYDALCHTFVSMDSIALVVFDEVHNCVKRNPGSKIMKDFYWRRKQKQLSVPHILGLTASPIMGSNLDALEALESLLDCTCRTPRLQREELSRHVNRPTLSQIRFQEDKTSGGASNRTHCMASLFTAHRKLNILEDPEILRWRTEDSMVSRNRLERALLSKKTFIQDQMKSFCRKAGEVYRLLGAWAVDRYISQVVSTHIKNADMKDVNVIQWNDAEKRYLANALQKVDISSNNLARLSEETISNKVQHLIELLISFDESMTGIIFVKERAIAHMLSSLLSAHPAASRKLRFATMVGGSQASQKKRDLYEVDDATDALQRFRSGEINILIATSVLEEGIDVPKCRLVICFDEPTNLKSYIQCRGRARLQTSRWVLLLEESANDRSRYWANLEREMKRKYEEEERNVQALADTEANDDRLLNTRQFRVASTDALLDMESAKGHLQCFCSRISSHASVDMRPEYIILEVEGQNKTVAGQKNQPLLRAKVILPATLDSKLRVFESKFSWHSEKNATKDAAFEAYVALYHAGLIDEHLLPLNFRRSTEPAEKAGPILQVQDLFNPWLKIAQAWEREEETLHRRLLTLRDLDDGIKCKIWITLPGGFSDRGPILVHWDDSTQWKFDLGPPKHLQHGDVPVDHTRRLLSLAYGHRWEVKDLRNTVHFEAIDMDVNHDRLLSDLNERIDMSVGLIRDARSGRPYLFQNQVLVKPVRELIQAPDEDYEGFADEQPYVALDKWTRRSDFLHPVGPTTQISKREYYNILPQSLLTVDAVPAVFSQFGMLIPSVLHKLEVQLIVDELCATILLDVEVPKRALILTAISAPVAREEDNYQKLELLGDSILKYLVSVFLASKHAYWPEGYLSSEKDAIVSNARLRKAAIESGLDKFILLKPFTGNKWRPVYVESLLEDNKDEKENIREMSSKTLADVVESLIGAGWKMGNCQTSLSIAKIFLPELDMPSIEVGRARLFDLAPTDVSLPPDLCKLETLAEYSFRKKSLLIQAVSHRSYHAAVASYERLEYLGDSILDFIIVTELMKYDDKISHSLIHLYKTALVNGDFLAFIAMEWKTTQKRTDLRENQKTKIIQEVESTVNFPLWRFMRHGTSAIGNVQGEVDLRHGALRLDILSAIESGTEYPWTLLASLHASKFFSDMVESLLGAVWVDSGSIEICTQLLGRMGILGYLKRFVQDQVHALHPKEELGILSGSKEVKYEVQQQKIEDGVNSWSCKVYVGEDLVTEDARGISDNEARTKAAEHAVRLLRFANGRSGKPTSYGERATRISSE